MKQDSGKKTRRSNLYSNKSGQAVVEYILLVAVSVSILIALKGAFKSAGDFTNNYIGAYTICLMEYGELPTLGLDEADLNKHKDGGDGCNPRFAGFTFAEGRPPIGDSHSSGSSKSSRSAQKDSASTKSSSASNSTANNREKSSSEGSYSSSTGGGAKSSSYGNGNIRRNGSGSIADGPGTSKVAIKEDEEANSDRADKRNPGSETRTIYRNRERYRALTGQMAEEFEKQEKKTLKKEPGRQLITKSADDGGRPGPRTSIVPIQERKVASLEEEKDSGWGLGSLVKWILIIGLIIVIIVFFGGQLLNYSNSDS